MNRPHVSRSPRILYYSHDTYGLGHLSRSLALAKATARRLPRAQQMIVTGSPVARDLGRGAPVELVLLPPVIKVGPERYAPREPGPSLESVLALRARALLAAARRFRPDLVVIDHAPLGLQGEALPLLGWLRARRPATRIVLGLRDIVDSPRTVRQNWRAKGVYPVLEHSYDRILVYGDRSVYDTARAYAIPPSVRRRLRHVGYLGRTLPARSVELARRPDAGRRLLVTAGGGGDGGPLFDAALAMVEAGRLPAEDRLHLVLGPLLDVSARMALHGRAAALAQVTVTDFAATMAPIWAATDAVLTMGGYNSLTEVVGQRLPCLVVPRTQPRREQLIRALAFEQRLGGQLRVLRPERLSAAALAEALETLPRRRGVRPPMDLGGLPRFAEAIAELVGEGREPAPRPGLEPRLTAVGA